MFEVKTSRSVDKGHIIVYDKKNNTNVKYDFIGRTSVGNGIQGYVENLGFEPNPQNSFSVVQVGENIAQFRNNEWYASQNIFILLPKDDKMVKNHYFVVSAINSTLKLYQGGYSNYPTLEKLRNDIVYLPVKNGEIDFEFMENFVHELEADRLEQLEAYLTLTGLKDYVLSDAENQAIENFNNGKVQWGEFRIGDLFERLSTKKLDYKAADLPKEAMGNFDLPCLTSSFQNQGLNYYVPKKGATILNNVISLPSNSDVYRGYYQSRDFTILSDAYAINWNKSELNLQSTHYLFAVTCINKVTDLKIYSYKNKLGGWNVVQNKNIVLPIKNGSIDYEYMELLISAIQKIVIKDVVQYADQRIEITKELINKDK